MFPHHESLFPPQQEVLDYGFLVTGFNCLLNMATGSGKTYLAEMAIASCLAAGYRAVYVTPLRALAEEKWRAWRDRFSEPVGIFTGDYLADGTNRFPVSYQEARLMIMTPERLDAVLRHWRSHWHWIPDVDLVVIDEFHLVGDPGRGPRLEGSITRLRRTNPFARILGLSATMSNVEQLADWLDGVYYSSTWRQVPLNLRVVRYRSANEKLPKLITEVRSCVDQGGYSLIFVNSRSRAQQVAAALCQAGIRSQHHHAGLDPEARRSIENSFRNGELQALVATSTLEMGLNLPARQVIVFDYYTFNGYTFCPLSVTSFMQRAGRAGRPGLDSRGEAILFAPTWAGNLKNYLEGRCEPVLSGLTASRSLAEQILIEVFAGYSLTRTDLEEGFLPLTLLKLQHPNATTTTVVNQLIAADMLEERRPDEGDQPRCLRVTPLGKLSVKLMLSPATVRLIRDLQPCDEHATPFDLLFIACLTEDCQPVLPANFEDLDALSAMLEDEPSSILELSLQELRRRSPEVGYPLRVLAAIKMACLCLGLIRGQDPEALAEQGHVYVADLTMLQESVVRILDGMAAVYGLLTRHREDDESTPEEADPPLLVRQCREVAQMLRYRLDEEGVTLTRIPGVGGSTARQLIAYGYRSLQDVALADPARLLSIPGIGKVKAHRIVTGALEAIKREDLPVFATPTQSPRSGIRPRTTKICPYRLRRSLELNVRPGPGERFYVTGGTEGHEVRRTKDGFLCDCPDFTTRQQPCKHILAVRRTLGDREITRLTNLLRENQRLPLRVAWPNLWFGLRQQETYVKEGVVP